VRKVFHFLKLTQSARITGELAAGKPGSCGVKIDKQGVVLI